MISRYSLAVIGALTMAFPSIPALAGPCTKMIDRAQAGVDARIDTRAARGPSSPESTGALLHHQPTPGSIAGAEQKAGEGSRAEKSLALLARARKADAAGDKAGCESALQELRALR
ncbi:hypothetical protein AB4072_00480 [Microvirga sp. 2MCAF38]|uniref:hypothetical protein n=1 Tax=Microvirga sp. 2MCAF38 TaxID=3232989 RepID=UPI003F9B2EB7